MSLSFPAFGQSSLFQTSTSVPLRNNSAGALDSYRNLIGLGSWQQASSSWSNTISYFGSFYNPQNNELARQEQIQRGIQDILGRPSTAGDLQTWNQFLAGGKTEDDLRKALAGSEEGRQATSEETVTNAYQMLLGREPDEEGLKTWTEFLKSGKSNEELIAKLRESDEYKNLGDERIRSKVNYTYKQLLGRDAEPEGLQNWVDFLKSGKNEDDLVAGFAEAPETRTRLENMVQTKQLFQTTLKRDPSKEELESSANFLRDGKTLADLQQRITMLPEYRQKNLNYLQAGSPTANSFAGSLGGFSFGLGNLNGASFGATGQNTDFASLASTSGLNNPISSFLSANSPPAMIQQILNTGSPVPVTPQNQGLIPAAPTTEEGWINDKLNALNAFSQKFGI